MAGKILTQSQTVAAWGWAPSRDKVETIPLHASNDGAKVTVRREAVPVFRLIDDVMVSHGYNVKRASTGSYVVRDSRSGGRSNHGAAVAVDYNWNDNPMRDRNGAYTCAALRKAGLIDMPCDMVEDILSIRSNRNGLAVVRWGGSWNSTLTASRSSRKTDGMHFDLHVAPDELRDGVYLGNAGGIKAPQLTVEDLMATLEPKEAEFLQQLAEKSLAAGASPNSYAWILTRYRRARAASTFDQFRRLFFSK